MRIRHLLASALVFCSIASAQSFTSVRELKNLSPGAIAKLHTLETLNALPGGDWRFHAGDIPHGESPTLDDSTWQIVPAPTDRKSYSKAPKEAVWYRRTIEVPKTLHGYDITGSRIWFQFEADANGPMPQIIYFNGRRVALGDDLEPIVLFDPAKPGDKILVAVKLLHTVDDKTFTGVNLRVEPPADSRPNPDDLRTECIVAANLLPALPAPRKDLLPTVESAIAAIDLTALAAGNQQAFDESLRKAEFILSPLAPILHQDKIDLAGNSHIDAAWLWPRSETIDVVKRTFTTALQLMNEYPDYTFTQSAAQYSAWIADKYPDLNEQIKQRVKEGRWEIVGGMWVEPDLNLPGGESLVRQLLVGQREFKALYGVTARIGWNPDSFGYNWQLPQIYKRSGMDYFVTQKMHWNDTNVLPFRLFWWESPDGSKVLTYFPTDYAWTNVNPTRLSADFAESAARNPGLTEHLDLFGVGDHGGGPTRDMLDQADKWIAKSQESVAAKSNPNLVISTEPRGSEASRGGSGETPVFANASAAGASVPAAIPIIRYSTAQNYFNHVETHLNPNSPTWNYGSIAKGYTPPPSIPALSKELSSRPEAAPYAAAAERPAVGPATNQIPQGFSLGSHSGEKKEGVSTPDPLLGIPTWNDELYFEYHRGIFTTQAKHKANMRRSETETLNAEKLASLAWLDGAAYPADALTENWKKITFNQFHDLAAGSGIATIYRDAQKDFYDVFNEDYIISQASMKKISERVDTMKQPGVPVLISNTLAWPRKETIKIDVITPESGALILTDDEGNKVRYEDLFHDVSTDIHSVLATVSVPALGYTVLHATTYQSFAQPRGVDEIDTTYMLANNKLIVFVDSKTGCITQILALNGLSFSAPNSCMNQLQAFADNPKNYDAWNIDPGTLDKEPQIIDKVDSIEVDNMAYQHGEAKLHPHIRIIRTWSKSKFIQDISLDKDADFVRIETTVDWHETHTLLKAAFPLAATSPKATYEIPYGAIQRPTTRNNSWEKAQFEVPALRWADLGDDKQGVSILNDSKYGYDALGNTLRLTLLRSPTWPDPDADQGLQHFTYEIYPHTGPWQAAQTVHRGYELNTPLTAQQVSPHTGTLPPTHSFASIDEPNIILSAVKKAEDANGLIFRFYEATGGAAGKPGALTTTHLHISPGALYAIETNLMETPLPNAEHIAITNDTLTIPTKPWEIRTLEVLYPEPLK
jgi:alpha-mannosidase